MTEPATKVKNALTRVAVPWDAQRTTRTLAALPARRARRRRRIMLSTGGACAALVCVAWLSARMHDVDPRPARVAQHSQETGDRSQAVVQGQETLQLKDGSTVMLLSTDARITLGERSAQTTTLELNAGRARFDVTHRPERRFRVAAGAVAVEVLGTRFTVERRAHETHVSVERGRVAVRWAAGYRELTPGEAGWFPPRAPASANAAAETANVGPIVEPIVESIVESIVRQDRAQDGTGQEPQAPSPDLRGDAHDARSSTPGPEGARPTKRHGRDAAHDEGRQKAMHEGSHEGWRQHAERGDFNRAYALLRKAPQAKSVADLMLAADSARLSGHPQAAVPYLREVVERHRTDARAPLAAFTLGGVLMNQLGLPREAEAAYRTARAMTRSEALAQDALARQVEAAHRAGDEPLARRLAEQYVDEYPKGRRLQAVRRFGQLP